jgi:hypothetical protein
MATDDENTASEGAVYAALIKALEGCSQDETVRTDVALIALGNVATSTHFCS